MLLIMEDDRGLVDTKAAALESVSMDIPEYPYATSSDEDLSDGEPDETVDSYSTRFFINEIFCFCSKGGC